MGIREISELLADGSFDAAYDRLDELGSFLIRDKKAGDLSAVDGHANEPDEECLTACVLRSMVLLPRMDLGDVRETWNWFVVNDDAPTVPPAVRSCLKRSLKHAPLLHGLVLCELGNLLFRLFQPREGYELVLAGEKLLKAKEPGNLLDPAHVEQAKIHAMVWLARLAWQEDKREEAVETLDNAASLIEGLRGTANASSRRGLDLIEAITLDMRSELAAIVGHIEQALEYIVRASVLVAMVRDSPRSGHISYMYGKLGVHEFKNMDTASRLFEAARELYGDHHPFRYRASNREVRVLARMERLDEAQELLDTQSKLLDNDGAIVLSEKTYCRKDFALTGCWIRERRAAKDRAIWPEALEYAQGIEGQFDWAEHPPRLEAELRFHLGRALAHTGQPESAIEQLGGGLSIAQDRSLEIALEFALAHAHLEIEGGRKDARKHWLAGHDLRREGVKSRFLEDWDDVLGMRLGQLVIDPGVVYKDALRGSAKQYLSYHLARIRDEDTLQPLLDTTGLNRTSLLRHLVTHGLEREAKRTKLFPRVNFAKIKRDMKKPSRRRGKRS